MNGDFPTASAADDQPAAAIEPPDVATTPTRADDSVEADVLPSPPEAGLASNAASPAPSSTSPTVAGLKIVLSLRLGKGPGQRALLGVGSEGRDPIYQAADVADLPAALDLVPALVASALARWQESPRYPAARKPAPAKSARPAPPPTTPAPSSPPTTAPPGAPPDAPASPPDPGPSPKPTSTGQLALFG